MIRPPRATVTSSIRAAGAALLVALPAAGVGGCARSGARAEEPLAGAPEVVLVRVGPLASEHPLYPIYEGLLGLEAARDATPEIQALRAFMVSPLGPGASLAPEPTAHEPFASLAWQEGADRRLYAGLEEADALLESWPRPGDERERQRLQGEAELAERSVRNRMARDQMEAETDMLERRVGELAELRHLASSSDRDEAAQALDRQARIWREVAAQVEAIEDEADREVIEIRRRHQQRLDQSMEERMAAWETERRAHGEQLREAGRRVRAAQADGFGAATQDTQPGKAPGRPAAPDTQAVSDLVEEIGAAQSSARERSRERLSAARARLLRQIAQGTRRAVRAIAAREAIEVRYVARAGEQIPDATETFRHLLRDYWAAQRPVREPAQ